MIATCDRLAGLDRLLDSLAAQAVDAAISVVIVDNSTNGTAIARTDDLTSRLPWPVVVLHEPTPGIPQARNRALEVALPISDYVVFVDDDEVVPPNWLERMLVGVREFGADVVTGPVVSQLPAGASRWLASTDIYTRRSHPRGEHRRSAATNNTMVQASTLRRLGLRFDENLALTGGSDIDYFGRLAAAGASIIWIDDVAVVEHVEPDRATLRWLCRRWFRIGNRQAAQLRDQRPSVRRQAALVAGGLGRVLSGPVVAIAMSPLDIRRSLGGVRWAAIGAGRLAAVLGFRFEEYAGDRRRRAQQAMRSEA